MRERERKREKEAGGLGEPERGGGRSENLAGSRKACRAERETLKPEGRERGGERESLRERASASAVQLLKLGEREPMMSHMIVRVSLGERALRPGP